MELYEMVFRRLTGDAIFRLSWQRTTIARQYSINAHLAQTIPNGGACNTHESTTP
jgi:hypothetical protein